MNRIRSLARLSAAALAVALVAVACASSGTPAAGGGSGHRIEVVAAENFWGFIAAQLGGDHVDLVSIISNPNTDPHDYEPTAADGRTFAQAQYVIENPIDALRYE